MLFLIKVSLPGVLVTDVLEMQTSSDLPTVRQAMHHVSTVLPALIGTAHAVYSILATNKAVLLQDTDRFDSIYRLVVTPKDEPGIRDCQDILQHRSVAKSVNVLVNGHPMRGSPMDIPLNVDVLRLQSIKNALKGFVVVNVEIGEDPRRSSKYMDFEDVLSPGDTVLRIACVRED